MVHKVSCDFAGRELTFEVGKLALQSDAAVVVTYGDTVVLATANVTDEPIQANFVPLRVDFEEKMYAVGRIPGGFFKREGRPSDETVIMGRSIDRPIRPLLPDGLRNDVQVVINPLSVESDSSVSLVAMIAGSAAMHISRVPFDGPFGAAQIGRVDGELAVNPTFEALREGKLNVLAACTRDGIVELEMEGDQVSEATLREALEMAHAASQPVIDAIEELRQVCGKPKADFPLWAPDPAIVDLVTSQFADRVRACLDAPDKASRNADTAAVVKDVVAALPEELAGKEFDVEYTVEKLQKKRLQEMVLDEGRRVDGRTFNQVRPITCEVGFLPRVHGSGLFTRGDTQVMTATTLGAFRDQKLVRSLDEEEYTHFIHHYNFPPFCTGEVRGMRSPGRREVGHGALAGKSVEYVIPEDADFPYTVRLVSEVMGGDASTSMASVCASCLSLMDAGVPIKAPVAGISIGLVLRDSENYRVFADMQAIEDFLGHMDFKVAGTREGVNAIQVDTKLTHLPLQVCFDALDLAREARLGILDIMAETIPYPRTELSPYAPRMYSVTIPTDKIGMVIGPGGKNVRKIQDENEVQIDIDDTGTVFIFGMDGEKANAARQIIADMTREIAVGEVFKGRVTGTTAFGAFVELMPGREALVHISHLAWEHIAKTEDIAKVGDTMEVKVIEVDDEGKIRASRKELLPRPAGIPESSGGGSRPRGGGGPSRGGRGGSHSGGSRGGSPHAGGEGGEFDAGRGKSYFREKKRD
ncbi:polyribonucleotide nucleotidyltransferase [bacterium]|nr:polyribonucleotide nucleotidyltransferase [bacterium]